MRKVVLTLAAATTAITALPAEAKHGHRHHARQYESARYWQGNDARYYCRKPDGTIGTIVGAAAGALVGRAIDTRGDRAPGTIIGLAAGALLGREVARSRTICR